MSVLPWPGVRACPAPSASGGQDGQEEDERRQVGGAEDVRQPRRRRHRARPRPGPTPRARSRVRGRLGVGRRRRPAGHPRRPGPRAPVRRRSPAGPTSAVIERTGDPILRVGRQPLRDRSSFGSVAGTGRRRAPSRRMPMTTISRQPRRSANDRSAKAIVVGVVPSAASSGASTTHTSAHRGQAAGARAGTTARPRSGVSAAGVPSTPRSSCGSRSSQRPRVGRAAISVVGHRRRSSSVSRSLAGLEGRDLRLVDDDVEEHPVRFDAQLGVVVDREVAERVRGDDRRQDEGSDDAARPAERGRAAGVDAGAYVPWRRRVRAIPSGG